jgi:hypothetical protein
MEPISEKELRNSLRDVRKAYRLLYLYQRRVKDLIEYIGSQYSRQCKEGWSKFSNLASNGKKINLNQWAWDWLNMYLYEFNMDQKTIGFDEIFFTIVLQSDTGFYDAGNSHDMGPQKLDVSDFSNPEESKTRLIFVVAKNDIGCPIKNLLKDHLNREETDFADGNWIGKAYEMEDFINEESTNKILNDFDQYCQEKLDIAMR